MKRIEMIRSRLFNALQPSILEIHDDSAAHAGHPGAQQGGGHFRIQIASASFSGKSALKRHRMVYDALADMMQRDIHALSIQALTPEQADAKKHA